MNRTNEGANEGDVIERIRPKVSYFLVDGETDLLDPSKYPFNRDELPLFCRPIGIRMKPHCAYLSGNRSIILPFNGKWFKAKAIGIPSGRSQPIYVRNELLTFFLTKAGIGSGRLIWGFSTLREAENELKWMRKAFELGLPASEPVGIGIYKKVRVIEIKDRYELFSYLRRSFNEVLEDFSGRSREVRAACVFCTQPTDLRVDEVLYAFSIPNIGEILGEEECKNFLRWLGSSCGYNLRMHHDNGIMHGTIQVGAGFMTNSHVANHLVSEEGTWMTDYHMAGEAKDEIKLVEVYCLCHVMNPLPHAELLARSRFAEERLPMFDLYELLTSASLESITTLGAMEVEPSNSDLTHAFLDGVIMGYYKKRKYEVDQNLKREMLAKSVLIKEKLWEILKLPKGMQRGVEYFRRRMKSAFDEKAYHDLRKTIEKGRNG